MKRSEKIFFVDNLAVTLASSKSFVLVDITGLKVGSQEKLRRALRDVGGKLIVAKNTLLTRALHQISGIRSQMPDIKPSLAGQTAVVAAEEDELAPIQVLGRFIKEFSLPRLKVGIVGGNIYEQERLVALSHLPGREVLASQAVGILISPLYGVVGTLQNKMQELVYILSTKSEALNSKQ